MYLRNLAPRSLLRCQTITRSLQKRAGRSSYAHLSAICLEAGAQLASVLIDSAKDRNRRAILRKITTLFGTSVPPALPNAMENCARCDWGLTTLSGEVNVRFITLLSLFDRTQGRVCGGKAG